ncbi:MAG: isoprenylcysteine carboxylmethyltransferase family protein [Chloroflexi bacterium]|nr:isoprenylcysteine carboxylmethyltransferase family protein [Chloroflexota bacterium]
MPQLIIFVIASAGIVYVSRASLRQPRAHGFYRFWAWEAILALVLLNAPAWFRDPFSWHQIIAWTLLVIAIIPLVLGVRLLRQTRQAGKERPDAALLGFERTAELVTAGVYRYIRHPMYSSLLFLALGAFFKALSWPGAALALAATGFLAATAKIEERENIRFFGPDYEAYMAQTKRFVPFVF